MTGRRADGRERRAGEAATTASLSVAVLSVFCLRRELPPGSLVLKASDAGRRPSPGFPVLDGLFIKIAPALAGAK